MWIVTTQDVLNRWVDGEAPYPDEPVFLTLLEDAQGLIRDEFSDLDERILTESFLLSKIKIVTAKVIQRAMKADYSGFLSQSNTDGAFGASRAKSTTTKQGLFLDDDDIEMLSPKGSRGGVQAIGFNDGPVSYIYDW